MFEKTQTFGYNLNRLTGAGAHSVKFVPTADGSNANLDYFTIASGYNTTVGSKVTVTDSSGSTVSQADSRGRPIKETRAITGGGTFVTQMSYNSADMVVTLTYPGNNSNGASETSFRGEKLTYSYYKQGAVKSIWSNPSRRLAGTTGTTADDMYYLQQGVYDAAGRTTLLNLGGSYQANSPDVQNAYLYFDWLRHEVA